MFRGSFTRGLAAATLCVALLSGSALAAQETKEPPTPQQLERLIKRLTGCLYPPEGATEAKARAVVQFTVAGNGRVSKKDIRIIHEPESRIERELAAAAVRAIVRCGPYRDFAGEEVQATFDPGSFE